MGIGDGLKRPFVPIEDFSSEIGKGIKCKILDYRVCIGNQRCMESNDCEMSPGTLDAMNYLEERGQTSIIVSVDGKTEAVIGLIDQPKDEASLAVTVLQKAIGIDVYMLTGDNFRTAQVVAKDIGIPASNVIANVLPEGKVECIQELQKKHRVAMVGDGINDSPALATSDIGIAIGAGTDVAIETAGIVLVNSKLTDVIIALHLARTIYRRIQLNFVWALGYNTLAIPIAAGILYPVVHSALPPFLAAVAMILSSLSVLVSSLLLNRYQPPKFEKKYGRGLRQGKLGLELVHIISGIGQSKVVQVQCENMAKGGPCSCAPELCGCHGCEEHVDKKVLKESDVKRYPGCEARWGGTCCCEVCRCSNCAKTSCSSK